VPDTEIGSDDPAAVAPARPPGPAARLAASREQRAGWLVIAVPAVTAFVVGGYELGGPSLWRDEAYTKDAISRSVSQLFAMLGNMDAVHGAYYLVMHVIVAVIGTSAVALRFPSLCAMVIAAGFTAAIGRRTAALAQPRTAALAQPRTAALAQPRTAAQLAGPGTGRRASRVSIPALTGLLSGLVFATAPLMTYYAQMARSYAIVTMFAAIATYLLLRAYPDGRWRYWSAYAAAVALTGLFNLFGLLIIAAHGVTLLLTDARAQAGGESGPGVGRRAGRLPLRWLAACAAAVGVLSPLLAVASGQQQQIQWLVAPDYRTINRLISDFAGSHALRVPVALLILVALAVACLADNWRPLNPVAVALPWLVIPPFVLIAWSYHKPVYVERYVEFCLPALAIGVGAGLAGIYRLAAKATAAAATATATAPARGPRLRGLRLGWLPAAVTALVVLGLAVMLVAPQRAIRQTAARPDNLRLASAIVAAHEQPGDVVFYIPYTMQVLGTGYPAPFAKLRNIALASSGVASATLTGVEVASPAALQSRFTDVRRVWVVTGASTYKFPAPMTPVDKEKMALIAGDGLHILHRWQAGEVMLTLYGP
jgi:mannosyltransferase